MTRAANVRLTIAFDGTDFSGWQVQPDQPTVQGTVAEALRALTGARVQVIGSGRTDAGAHARALVASFRTDSGIEPRSLARALNSRLPETIRVLAARRARAAFHAQRSARSKVYRYQIYRGDVLPPHLAREHYHYPYPLDLAPMRQAAALFVGTHDFRGFAKTSSAPVALGRSTLRTLLRSELRVAGRRLVYTVEADGFLHHMVRNIVGTLIEVGRGHRIPATVAEVLREGDRRRAGFTAPARGLVLVRVRY